MIQYRIGNLLYSEVKDLCNFIRGTSGGCTLRITLINNKRTFFVLCVNEEYKSMFVHYTTGKGMLNKFTPVDYVHIPKGHGTTQCKEYIKSRDSVFDQHNT